MTIEPMTIDRMRHIVGIVTIERQHAMKNATEKPIYSCRDDFMTLIKRWAHAEARAREAEFNLEHRECFSTYGCVRLGKSKHEWKPSDWLAEVLREIGWPNE